MKIGKYEVVLSNDKKYISFYDKDLCVADYLCKTLQEDSEELCLYGLDLRSGIWTMTGSEMAVVMEYIKGEKNE